MNASLKVLHIEDDIADAELIASMLHAEGLVCDVTRVETREAFERALKGSSIDVILCDYNIPSFDGNAALELALRERGDVPFIFVSGTIGEDRAIEALKMGATDYVLKNRLQRLVPALRRALREVEERKRREQLQRELLQAQKMESLGVLAGGIAHDFNNILGIILGHATVLQNMPAGAQMASSSLKAILNATERGAALVRQLLTFARKGEARPEATSANDEIQEIITLIRGTFPKTITVESILSEGLPSVVVDRTQFHQVLLNLSINARDAMPEGGELLFATRQISGRDLRSRFPNAAAEEYVVIDISDTGVGMSEEEQKRAFERFFTTKERGKGTGLGLSVVFGVLESHSGFVDVHSEVGRGTRFSLFLPAARSGVKPSLAEESSSEKTPGGTETLLVVEDEVMLRELMKIVLTEKGYTVLTAVDGADAIKVYRARSPEIALVLCDLDLPKLDGREVLRVCKNVDPAVKFLLATGFVDPGTKSQILADGATGIISKPYVLDEVLRRVRAVLDGR